MRYVVLHRVPSLTLLPLKVIYHSVITESMINCLLPLSAAAGAFPCLKIEFHCGRLSNRPTDRDDGFGGNQGEERGERETRAGFVAQVRIVRRLH